MKQQEESVVSLLDYLRKYGDEAVAWRHYAKDTGSLLPPRYRENDQDASFQWYLNALCAAADKREERYFFCIESLKGLIERPTTLEFVAGCIGQYVDDTTIVRLFDEGVYGEIRFAAGHALAAQRALLSTDEPVMLKNTFFPIAWRTLIGMLEGSEKYRQLNTNNLINIRMAIHVLLQDRRIPTFDLELVATLQQSNGFFYSSKID